MQDEHAESTGRAEGDPAPEAMEPRMREALAWLGLLAPGVALTPAAATTLLGLESEAEAHAVLRALVAGGLLEPVPILGIDGRKLLAYRPLPHLAAVAPAAAAATHEALLDRYRARTRGGAWYTLPDDGYIHGALAWHLEQAGGQEELRALLAEETAGGRSGWHEARERLGQVPGYLQDLERARQRAAQKFAAGGRGAGTALALQCRYALMASSLHSLAPEIPPALLCALVRDGSWSPAQGLAAAGGIPDPALRGEALVSLAAEMPASLIPGLIDAALALDDEQQRARALLSLARRLPTEQLGLALDAIRHLPGEEKRARALTGLAPHLPASALEQALAAALALQDPTFRVEAVSGLAAHLPAELLPAALAAVLEIEDEAVRTAVLCRLLLLVPRAQVAPHLPEALFRQALAGTWRMRDAAARSEAQVALAPHLPPYWRDKALAAALDGLAQVHFARATLLLATMAPHLPTGLQERAIALAETQPDSRSRVSALTALLPHLSPQHREPAADLALRSTLLIRSEAGRAEAIARLVPHLPTGLLERALAMVQSLADGHARAVALAAMAPFLDRRLAGDALSAARTIQDERSCAMALAALAPLLDTGQQRQALLRVGSLADEKARAIALVGLAPVLAPGLLPGALAEARRITDQRALTVALAGVAPAFDEAGRAGILAVAADIADPALRLDAILSLLPCLSAPQRVGAVEAGWRAIQALGDEQARIAALARLAPHLAPGDDKDEEGGAEAQRSPALDQVLSGLAAIQDPERRCQAILALVPHLPAPLREEALTALPLDDHLGLHDKCKQAPAVALLALIPHLPGPLQAGATGVALAAARRLPGPARSRALGGLVPYLDAKQLGEALAAAREIGDDEEQLRALVALAPTLEEAGRREVLRAVGQVSEAWKRAALLTDLAPHLPESLRPEALAMVREPDRAAASQLALGAQQAEVAASLPRAVPEILHSARRAGDCRAGASALTSLARVVGDEEQAAMLQEAGHAARSLAQTLARLLALDAQAQVAPYLVAEAQQEAAGEVLQAVRACAVGPQARLLDQALAAVAPFLPVELVPAAMAEARRLAVPRAWSRQPEESALSALARRLPEEMVRAELAAAGTIRDLHLRAQTLSALAVRLGELGHGQEAISAARPIEPLPYLVDALLHLAPNLSLPWLREAQGIARELGHHAAPVAARIAVRLAELGEGEEGWRAAGEIPEERWRVEALAGLAPHLPAGHRAAAYAGALDAACAVHDAGERLRVLARLIALVTPRPPGTAHLPGALQVGALREVLGAAVALKEEAVGEQRRAGRRPCATPLSAMAAPLAALAAWPDAGAALREIWLAGGQGERLLTLLGHQLRPTALLELAALAPLLARLGGPAASGAVLAAVQQVTRWWP